MQSPLEFYKENLLESTSEIRKVGWKDEDKAVKRYMMASQLLGKQQKIIDVGCGLGTLSQYVDCDMFVGLDIVSDYIYKARELYPSHYFLDVHVDKFVTSGKCAYVSLGAYTYVGSQNIYEFLGRMHKDIEFMVSMESPKIVINGFHNNVSRTNPTLYYHDLNTLVTLANAYDDQYTCEIHIFSKYEFFLVLTRKLNG